MSAAISLVIASLVLIECCSCTEVSEAFEQSRAVPDAVPTAPQQLLTVKYGDISVDLGNSIQESETFDPPTSISWDADSDSYYTLLLIGTIASAQHWFVGNIPGSDVTKGETYSEYFPPSPPKITGRYIFVVYLQPSYIEFKEPHLPSKTYLDIIPRVMFSAKDFAEKYNLGDPLFGNFCYVTPKLINTNLKQF